MNLLSYVFSLVMGGLCGWAFFRSLHWTIKVGLTSRRPWCVFFFSYFVRMTAVLLLFYFVGQGNIVRLLCCLLGFIVAKFLLKKWVSHAS